jgi:hypothetical protein
MIDPLYKQMTAFLLGLGIEEMEHTGKTYLGHLIAVHRLMGEQACSTDACRAGLFHSISGTEAFRRFQLPLDRRAEIRELIGERAERLAYLNCAMDRASFDAALRRGRSPFQILDRLTGEEVAMGAGDFDDLGRVHLYDWLEQAPRSRLGYGYRRAASRGMAERPGPGAIAASDRVYAGAPVATD